ncbi:MAG: hypothetical protein AB7U99_07065, partial [Steroidobacteraceae bacterium]
LTEQTERDHPILLMAARLPNCFEIRATDSTCLEAAELLLADERGVLYRIQPDRWDGMANIYDPMVARFYRVQFDTAWNAAQPPTPLEHSVSLQAPTY